MRKSLLVGGVLWTLVVALGAVLVWWAIDIAGRDLLTDQSNAPAATPTTPLPTSTTPTPSRSATPSPSSSGTRTGAPPSQSATPNESRTPTEEPSATASAPVTRSWSGSPGTVVVRCSGRAASLVSATPADGWAVEVEKRGPEEVRVEFVRGEDERRVDARCSQGGGPSFEVDDS